MEHYNVTIIGSGPAGCTAAIYAARYGYSVALHEGLQPGGQLMNKATTIENFPSYQNVSGGELMQSMMDHARSYVQDGWKDLSTVERISPSGALTLVESSTGSHTTDYVIVASGSKPRMLPVAGIEELIGKGVSTCATCDGFFYRNKSVMVVGGGDSAMEAIMYLTKLGAKVVSVHRSEDYRASKILYDRAHMSGVVWWANTEVTAVERVGKQLQVTTSTKGQETSTEIDGLFVSIGHTPNKVEVAEGTTNVYYAGDVIDSEWQQAITAAADGCRVAMQIHRTIQSR